MSEELFDRIRGLSQKAVNVAVPDEVELFGAVWVGCEPWVQSVWATDPGQWSLGDYREQLGSSLGVVDGIDALDLVSPKVVATITAVLHILTRVPSPSACDAIRLADQYARQQFELKDDDVIAAIGTVLASDVEVLAAPGTLGVRGDRRRVVVWVDGRAAEDRYCTPAELAGIREQYDNVEFLMRVDQPSGEVRVGDKEVWIPPRPLRFLVEVMVRGGVEVSHEELLASVFSSDGNYSEQDIYQARRDLCRALAKIAANCADYVRNVPGVGYRWTAPLDFFLVCAGSR